MTNEDLTPELLQLAKSMLSKEPEDVSISLWEVRCRSCRWYGMIGPDVVACPRCSKPFFS